MAQARIGDTVKVHYQEYLQDGTVLDSSFGRNPIEFTLGEKMVIPGFEEAILGMEEGDKKSISLSAPKAYGIHHDELVLTVRKDQLPSDIDPEVGMVLQIKSDGGRISNLMITNISDGVITLDGNHPLAGKEIFFNIQLIQIV